MRKHRITIDGSKKNKMDDKVDMSSPCIYGGIRPQGIHLGRQPRHGGHRSFALDVNPVVVVVVPSRCSALEVDLALLLSIAVAFVGKCAREEGERVSSPCVW